MVQGRWVPTHRALVIVLALVVIVAGSLGAWYFISTHAPSSPAGRVVADGPTFYQALAPINESVKAQPGGSWTLYTVWGIASPLPFAPSAVGWVDNPGAVNDCGALFNGVTMWNGSIPLFNGTFNSGTAPFWQFAYFSNSSESLLIATNILGVVHVYPPFSMDSPCAEAQGANLASIPWVWAGVFEPFPADTPTMAQSAWNEFAGGWTATNPNGFEAFVFGSDWWGSGNPGGLVVRFARCGQVGFTGVQPYGDVFINPNGTSNSYDSGIEGCGDVEDLEPNVYAPYELSFSPANLSTSDATQAIALSFRVTQDNGSYPDAGGLVTWMVSLGLNTSQGSELPSVPSGCPNWTASIQDCVANSSGWYAVLVSPNGAWLDSYPAITGGTNWTMPNVEMVSGQVLVVVVPISWDPAGDTLFLGADALLGGYPAVSGSGVL